MTCRIGGADTGKRLSSSPFAESPSLRFPSQFIERDVTNERQPDPINMQPFAAGIEGAPTEFLGRFEIHQLERFVDEIRIAPSIGPTSQRARTVSVMRPRRQKRCRSD